MTLPLADRHIVVTRPAGQAAHLAQALVELGAHPLLFPVLAISAVADPTPLFALARRLEEFNLAVFVSPNAIERGLPQILAQRPWPKHLPVATLGKSSENALRAQGIKQIIAPEQRFDSEALLELPTMQDMRGKRVLILRGDNGRPLLGDTLSARGAEVEYLTCYRRSRPATHPAPLIKLWSDQRLDAVTLTSSEGVRNLYDMVGKLGQAWLRQTPTFVTHQRILETAQKLNFRAIILTKPGDEGLLAGLTEYFA